VDRFAHRESPSSGLATKSVGSSQGPKPKRA
jgi:hypothetical protein